MSGSRIAPAPLQTPPAPEREVAETALEGGAEFLQRAEVRDVLAWVRLLIDPQDGAAVARALSRPPVQLRQVDLARVIQVARRGGSGLAQGLAAATASPQVPPEARERVDRFAGLHAGAAADLDSLPTDVFLARLIERLGAPTRSLLTGPQARARREGLDRLLELAAELARLHPGSSTRDTAARLVAAIPGPPSGLPAEVGQTPHEGSSRDGDEVEREALEAAVALLREELLDGIARISGRLGELRLDTDLDISHGVVRYLELLKLSALLQRSAGETLEDTLADVNARLLAAATPLQREILQTSSLDETLLDRSSSEGARRQALMPREEHSLRPFLPRRGIGLALSASDIQTYRTCPLRYKFARVLRIPSEQTVHQRFGIVVHQVLERYHSEGATTLAQLLDLLDAVWRRSALGDGDDELALRAKARDALTVYHARLDEQGAQPVWFERVFDFRLGPHHLRGRVDRVDRLPPGGEAEYELIDYKTSRPRTPEQLADDVQLSLYALAAREAWQLESSSQAYYYVLDDVKAPVPRSAGDADAVRDTVLEVGEGILAQTFEPTPSPSACASCDYRIACPVAAA